MNPSLILPIVWPLLVAAILLFMHKTQNSSKLFSLVGSAVHLALSTHLLTFVLKNGPQGVQLGSWPAPFGISVSADMFGALMVLVSSLIGLCVNIFSCKDVQGQSYKLFFQPLFHILMMGLCGIFLTADIFNLYVWFEVLLVTSFVLLIQGNSSIQLRGASKYVILNLFSSALFLVALAFTYGFAGSLNMADLALMMPKLDLTVKAQIATLFLIAFGIKAGIFPLFFWLPDSYHTPSVSVSAIFAGLLTKVGVYSMVRIFTSLFSGQFQAVQNILLLLGGLTMLIGVLGAVAQMETHRLLSFHIVSQVGYMIFGLGIFTVASISATIYYILFNIIAKTNLFLIAGLIKHQEGHFDLKKLGGLYKKDPLLSFLFLCSALALAGIPPLSGFFGKYLLARAGFESGYFALTFLSLAVGMLTLFSMAKIWNQAFWKAAPDPALLKSDPRTYSGHARIIYLIPISILSLAAVLMGLAAEPCIELTDLAARQLLPGGLN